MSGFPLRKKKEEARRKKKKKGGGAKKRKKKAPKMKQNILKILGKKTFDFFYWAEVTSY
jgi:hypothetical protein